MSLRQTYYSPLYRNFREIGERDYQRIIRFYEEKEAQIGQLNFGEYFDLTVAYVDALFETGTYRKHLLMVDGVIEASIEHNVQYVGRTDIYRRMLFRKAASCYRLQEYDTAAHVLRELIRMDPAEPDNFHFYWRVLRTRYHRLQQVFRAIAIVCFLLAAIVICVEVLAIRSFYPSWTGWVENSRNLILGLGLLAFGAGELLAAGLAYRSAIRFRGQLTGGGRKKAAS